MLKNKKFLTVIAFILIAGSIFFIVRQNQTDPNKRKYGLWYVYSGSMEPTIGINDGFIIYKANNYNVGDVIVFKPQALNELYVTHRIIQIDSENRFITKGDNNPMTDQQGGEPPVGIEQVRGKALSLFGRLFVIPKLGRLTAWSNSIAGKFNIFIILFTIICIVLVLYFLKDFLAKKRSVRRKRRRLLDKAPYFDYVFWLLCVVVAINSLLIAITLKGWGTNQVSYVVVSTEGLASPVAGQEFTISKSMNSSIFIPLVAVLEPRDANIEAQPGKLQLRSAGREEYKLNIVAPHDIGYFTQKIDVRVYPDFLSDKLFDFLYSRNRVLPLVFIFAPGILMAVGIYLWWLRRWRIGRREVMGWLFSLRILSSKFRYKVANTHERIL